MIDRAVPRRSPTHFLPRYRRLAAFSLVIAGLLAAAPGPGCNRTKSGSRGSRALVINEVMANATPDGVDPADAAFRAILLDAAGNPELDPESPTDQAVAVDWVEIFNPLAVDVNLRGYTLSDSLQRPRKYRFPPGFVLGPGEFIVITCDGRKEAGLLHASFRLDPAGETVYLFGDNGDVLLDQVTYSKVPENVAVGRPIDGSKPVGAMGGYDLIWGPTPGGANNPTGIMLPHDETMAIEFDPVDPTILHVTVTVVDDVAAGGIVAAAIQARGHSDCHGDGTLGAWAPLDELPDHAVEDVNSRGNFNNEPVVVPVRQLTFVGDLDTADVPDFSLEGVLRLRVRFEARWSVDTDVVGTTTSTDCLAASAEEITLVINEYQPRNQGTLLFDVVNVEGIERPEPASPDWFEIYNYGEATVNLAGFSLIGQRLEEHLGPNSRPLCPPYENRPDCLFVWYFAEVDIKEIGPGEHILVLADNDDPPFKQYFIAGSDRSETFHSTHFRISGEDADSFALLDPRGVVVDRVDIDFSRPTDPPAGDPLGGGTAPNVSFGRIPDGFGPESPLDMDNLDLDSSVGRAHTVFTCPTPGELNARVCEVAPEFDRMVWVTPVPGARNLFAGNGRLCPRSDHDPEVKTYVSFDKDTVEMDAFDVTLIYTVGDGVPVRVAPADGLELRLVTDPERDCFRPVPIPGAVQYRVSHLIPRQPAGTRVTFRFEASDHLQERSVTLEASPDLSHASFFYVVRDEEPPAPVVNEVLPRNETVLEHLYPDQPDESDFRPPDYIEFFNPTDEAIDLGGMFLAEAKGRLFGPDNNGDLFFCPSDPIDNVREFEIPAGTIIGSRDFLLVLFVSDNDLNTEPDLEGQPFQDRTLLVKNSIRLDNCQQSIFLISGDDDGNCQLARAIWHFPENECEADTVLGRSPDGTGDLVALCGPSPGESNSGGFPPELAVEVDTSVVPFPEPGACLEPRHVIVLAWSVHVDLDKVDSNPTAGGLESIEIVLELDGVPESPRPIEDFVHSIAREQADDVPRCRARVGVQVTIPAPEGNGEPGSLDIGIRMTDTGGEVLEIDPVRVSLPVCARQEVTFVRGDVSGDGRVNITDVVQLNQVLFGSRPLPDCQDVADVNDDGVLDADDVTALIAYLEAGQPIPPPFPDPGEDPTPDGLECGRGG